MEKKLRILMVEDSEDDAELVMRFARQNRARPDFFRVDAEALMLKALNDYSWDLIISDYHLPSFSGPEAIKVLQSLSLDIPLIIVSGTVGEDTAIDALKIGATDYVLKSNLGRLPSAIDRALQEAQLRREQRESESQLIQAQKMDAVGRLAGGVAHDVNNVLAAITLFAEIAIEQIQGNDLLHARESLNGILKAQETATSIIRQLLLFSRRRIDRPQVIDFVPILLGIQPLITRLVGDSISVSIHAPPAETVNVLGDRTELEQIILNLAVNARDAMPQGGSLHLTLETRDLKIFPPGLRISVPPGKYAVLTAQDTGCGMSEEIQNRLFEPFFTTKEPGKGTGLGLSVIFGILRHVGGTLSVESSLGLGTTFQIYWPLDLNTKTIGPQSIENKDSVQFRPLSILLVEDEDLLREIMATTLRKQGHTVLEANDGEEGEKIFIQELSKIDLLITDVYMPRMGGAELIEKAHQLKNDLPVLFLSGYANATLQGDEINSHLIKFLEKPFTSHMLKEKVDEVLQLTNLQKNRDAS